MTAASTALGVGHPRQLGPLWCPHPRVPEAVVRLVCFPHAGGGSGTFRTWAAELAPEVEVWTASLPGRGTGSDAPPALVWPDVVGDLADAVVACAGEEPLALLGHSLGGMVAYEVARELERRGGPAARHLFVSGCRAPHRSEGRWRPPAGDDLLVFEVDERYGAVPQAVRREPELLARFVPILRADLELAAAYEFTPGPKLRSPITALAGAEDRAGPPPEMAHWQEHTDGHFSAVTLPGTHFFIHSELQNVAEIIRRTLT